MTQVMRDAAHRARTRCDYCGGGNARVVMVAATYGDGVTRSQMAILCDPCKDADDRHGDDD